MDLDELSHRVIGSDSSVPISVSLFPRDLWLRLRRAGIYMSASGGRLFASTLPLALTLRQKNYRVVNTGYSTNSPVRFAQVTSSGSQH